MADNKPIIDININNIFYQLHDTALKQSAQANDGGKLVIGNSGVDEKNATYTGSGEFTIISQPDASDETKYLTYLQGYQQNVDDFKVKCFTHIQKYVEFFIGEKAAKSIKPDMLNPLYPTEQGGKKNESVRIDYSKPLLENLFEADDGEEPGGMDSEEKPGKKDDPEDDPSDMDTEKKPIGFELQYDSNIAGIKRKDYSGAITDWLKNAGDKTKKMIGPAVKSVFGPLASAIGKSLFGGLVDDLASFHVDTIAGDIKAGQIAVDVTKGALKGGKALAGMAKDATNLFPTIDKDKVDNDVSAQIRKVAPHSDIHDVFVYTPDEMRNKLVSQKRLTSEIKRELEEVSYVMEIVVPHGSKDYQNIDSDWIAKNVCIAVNKNYKINRYKPKDFKVICIKDVKPTYKLRSEYDQDLGKKLTQEVSKAFQTKRKTKKESLSRSTHDSLMVLLFEDGKDGGSKTDPGKSELEKRRDAVVTDLCKHCNTLPVVIAKLNDIMPAEVDTALGSAGLTKASFIESLTKAVGSVTDDDTGRVDSSSLDPKLTAAFEPLMKSKACANNVFALFESIIEIIQSVNKMKPEYKKGRPSRAGGDAGSSSDTYLVFNKYIKEKKKDDDADR